MNLSSSTSRVPLEPWDDMFYVIDGAFGGAATGVVVSRVQGFVEESHLRGALARLQRRHPRLRASVVESDEGRRFFELPAAPPPVPVDFEDYDAPPLPWKEESIRLLSVKLAPAVDPLIRLLILRSRTREASDIILLAHHVIADGSSGLRLMSDLLSYYEDAERDASLESVEPLPMLSGIRARPGGTWLRRLGAMARLASLLRANRRGLWTSLPPTKGVPGHRLWTHHVYSERDTLRLARRCRREKATVYGALFAAAARALGSTMSLPRARFKCRFPMDIRGKLVCRSGSVTESDLGNFISGLEKIYTFDERTPFWDYARRAHADVASFDAAGGPSLVYNLVDFLKRRPGSRRLVKRGTLFVSSYGVVGARERYGSLTQKECAVMFNADRVGPSLMLQSLVIQRRMNLNMNAVDVSEEFWRSFSEETLRELAGAMDGDAA